VIYIYRPPVMANMMYSPDLYINDEYRAPVKSGEHYHFTLSPGEYSLGLKHDDIDGNGLAAETFTAGSVYYFRVTTSLKLNETANYQPYQRRFTRVAMDAPLAIEQISECCLKDKPANDKTDDDNTVTTEDNKDADTGFSVDKTQNPFSH
jgi:hypothetical protein